MKRLPNNFGSVVKLSGKRTNPYMVRVRTKEATMNHETGTVNQNYKVIGYAKTRDEGLNMLYQYHHDPQYLRPKMTFKEIYYNMYDEYVAHLSRTSQNSYDASYKAMSDVHERVFSEIKMKELQRTFDNTGKNYPTLQRIKILLNQMYKWAMKYDLVDKDYSRYIELGKHKHKNPNSRKAKIFKRNQIDVLWDIVNSNEYYQVILMLIYTGVRISELLDLKLEDIYLDEQYFDVIESKTEAGVRKVPIADVILPFFKYWMDKTKCEYLITKTNGERMLYSNFLNAYWKPIIQPLGWDQTPHHTRHTFVTLITEAEIQPTYIKLIVGHEGAMTVTERVYTHIPTRPLIEAVNQMYVPGHVKHKIKEEVPHYQERTSLTSSYYN